MKMIRYCKGGRFKVMLALLASMIFLTGTMSAVTLRCKFHDEGGKPLKNVEVQLAAIVKGEPGAVVGTAEPHFQKSNKAGEATFSDLKSGLYQLRAQLGDRMPTKREVQVTADQTLEISLLTQKEFDQVEKEANEAISGGQYSKALPVLEKLIADYPDDAPLRQSLGLAYAGLQQEEKALAEAARAAQLDPQFANSPDVVRALLLRERGQTALKSQNYAAAADAFAKWAQIQPQNAQAHYALALAYGHQGKYTEALMAINKALELAPQNESYLKVKGILETNAGAK
jgi:tetratricopeptide (TPR) repeat protein